MDPDQNLRKHCVDLALRASTASPVAMLDLAGAMERFIRNGDYRRFPRLDFEQDDEPTQR